MLNLWKLQKFLKYNRQQRRFIAELMQLKFESLLSEKEINIEGFMKIPEGSDFADQVVTTFLTKCPRKWVEIREAHKKLEDMFSILGIQTYSALARQLVLLAMEQQGIIQLYKDRSRKVWLFRLSPLYTISGRFKL